MTLREISPLQEIDKLERKFKFLFFLSDIGIKSAHKQAVKTWDRYLYLLSDLNVSE